MIKNNLSRFLFIFIYIISLNMVNGQEKNITYFSFRSEIYNSENEIKVAYDKLNLASQLDYNAFKIAYLGFQKIEKENPILTIIDFTKPSTEKRFFVLDLKNNKLLFNTYVSHGRNSGDTYAKYFSNESTNSPIGIPSINE